MVVQDHESNAQRLLSAVAGEWFQQADLVQELTDESVPGPQHTVIVPVATATKSNLHVSLMGVVPQPAGKHVGMVTYSGGASCRQHYD